MSLYDRVLARNGGARALAVARLKRAVLSSLHEAFNSSGMRSQSELAKRLGVRRSAVNQVFHGDGNVRISTLAEYLHEMGYELDLTLTRSGEPRSAALEGRYAQPAPVSPAFSDTAVLFFQSGPQAVTAQSATPPFALLSAPSGEGSQNRIVTKSSPQGSLLESAYSTSFATQIRMGTGSS